MVFSWTVGFVVVCWMIANDLMLGWACILLVIHAFVIMLLVSMAKDTRKKDEDSKSG